MAASAKHVGIDLGTSTSALAYVQPDGSPAVVPNSDGERLTPSVVFFDPFEDVKLIGSSARDGGDPERTVGQIKRHMGDPDYSVEFDGRKWTPTEISALILSKLKNDCSQFIGEIEDVVITVPANFNELARRATIDAGKLAGLNVTRIVNEPTAAALYYALTQGVNGRVMVFDMGGGTLDITILFIQGRNIHIQLSEGARHLGGCDFDQVVNELIREEYRQQKGCELQMSPYQSGRLMSLCEDTKKMLSKLNVVTETFATDKDGLTRVTLTRERFEAAIGRLLIRTTMLVEQALDSLEIGPSDIDEVLLVGGSTRIPKIRENLEKFFGKPPLACANVDECVALGAALFAQQSLTVHEVCNHSYGILALVEDAKTGEAKVQNSIVIPKNTPIPCAMSQTFLTSEDDESIIEVEITQGEDVEPRFVNIIGKIQLEVPPSRPAGSEVTITYSYDENQRVRAEIHDSHTGLRHDVEIEYKGKGVLTEEELVRKSAYLKKVKVV